MSREQVQPVDAPIGPHCGGSGTETDIRLDTKSVDDETLDLLIHAANRHEVFKCLDRRIAGQMHQLLNSDIGVDELVASLVLLAEKAVRDWSDDHRDRAIALIFSLTCTAVYAMETLELDQHTLETLDALRTMEELEREQPDE